VTLLSLAFVNYWRDGAFVELCFAPALASFVTLMLVFTGFSMGGDWNGLAPSVAAFGGSPVSVFHPRARLQCLFHHITVVSSSCNFGVFLRACH
jgi:hypothetical protein